MVEKRPLIPRSRLDGGIHTEPHPATIASNQTPDSLNAWAQKGAEERRPGLNPLHRTPAKGSMISQRALHYHGESVDHSERRDYSRRAWYGAGIIPYVERYDWEYGFWLAFRYKVGNTQTALFQDHSGADTFRRMIIGSGNLYVPVADTLYAPNWLFYLADGTDNDAFDGGAGAAGSSYPAFAFQNQRLTIAAGAPVVSSIGDPNDPPWLEGDEVDVILKVSVDNDPYPDTIHTICEWRFAHSATWYGWDVDWHDGGAIGAGDGPLYNDKRLIQVFGPYDREILWAADKATDHNVDWWSLRLVPAEGGIESILFRDPEEWPADWTYPSSTRLTDNDLLQMGDSLRGYWPGYGPRDGQFIDKSKVLNHGYFAPGPPRIFEEEDRLPGLQLDGISTHAVQTFENDDDYPLKMESDQDMLQQICDGGANISSFRDAEGNPVINSITLGVTVTLWERRQVDLVRLCRWKFEDIQAHLQELGAGHCVIAGIEACAGPAPNFWCRATMYGMGPGGADITIDGPELPYGVPVTVTLVFTTVEDQATWDYTTTGHLFVNGRLVNSSVGNVYEGQEETHWGPIREILAGPFHGLLHDVRLGCYDYNAYEEHVGAIAVPDIPVSAMNLYYTGGGPPPGVFLCDLLTYGDNFPPSFYDAGGNPRQIGMFLPQCRTARADNLRHWWSGWRDFAQAGARPWQRTVETQAPDNTVNQHNTIIPEVTVGPPLVYESELEGDCIFSWILGWWRAWPTRAGDPNTNTPVQPSRLQRTWWHRTNANSHEGDHCAAWSSWVMADVMDTFPPLVWAGSFKEMDQIGVLQDASGWTNPVVNESLPPRSIAPSDLGLKWEESSLLPVDEDGEIAFIHNWHDDEGDEIFIGSGRNLYLLDSPWGDHGARFRNDGYNYWESDTTQQAYFRPVNDGTTNIWIGFWYRRDESAGTARMIVGTVADDDNHPWTIWEHRGVLNIGMRIGGAPISIFTILPYPPGTDGYHELFHDRRPHWVVVKIEGQVGGYAIEVYYDGYLINVLGAAPQFAAQAYAGNLRLRVGGGLDRDHVDWAAALCRAEIWEVAVGVGAACPFPINPPIQEFTITGDIGIYCRFDEMEGYQATWEGNGATGIFDYYGKDLRVISHNLPFLGGNQPEVLQTNLDAAMICKSGLPRRWRRDRDYYGSDSILFDYLGLPDPWEAPIAHVPATWSEGLGEMEGAIYTIGVRFYDEVRDIYTRMRAGNALDMQQSVVGAFEVYNIPRLPYGLATHTEILVSTGNDVWQVARKLEGTNHYKTQITHIDFPEAVEVNDWGEPPIAAHGAIVNERLHLGNLPRVSTRAIQASRAGQPWSYPPINIFAVGDSQDGIIKALHAGMGRLMAVQEGLISWVTPAPYIANYSQDPVARSIGFICRWGPVTWSGPLIGMTTRGPATTDGLQFQFLGANQQSLFTSNKQWTVAYDSEHEAWWFILDSEEDFCIAIVLSRGASEETWSPLTLPTITAVTDVVKDNKLRFCVGTRHGKVCLVDGTYGDCIREHYTDGVGSYTLAAKPATSGSLHPLTAGVGKEHPEEFRGQPFYYGVNAHIVLGPDMDGTLTGLRVREVLAASSSGEITVGQVKSHWTSPWLDFGMPTRSKKVEQLWLAFAAVADTIDVDVVTAGQTGAKLQPLYTDFPTPEHTYTVNMTNGFMNSPLQIVQNPGGTGIYFRFRVGNISTTEAWKIWHYVIEGELTGGRAR